MAYQIPAGEPESLTAGTTWSWTRTLADWSPATGDSLTYYLTGPAAVSLPATAGLATDSFFTVTIAASTTQAYAPGVYRWTARVTAADGSIHDPVTGKVSVAPDVAVAANTDQRSHAVRMLAAIEAELQARVTGTGSAHESYAVDGRSLNKIALHDLHALRSKYASEVQREQFDGHLAPVHVRFGRSTTSGTSGDCQWTP